MIRLNLTPEQRTQALSPTITVPLPEGVTVRRGVLSGPEDAMRMLMSRVGVGLSKGKSGRPRSDAPRCACGEMTVARAATRGHKCGLKAAKAGALMADKKGTGSSDAQ